MPTQKNNPIIHCHDVSRFFGSTPVLQHITLSVNNGEICFLMGPNGSGKTTLIKILSGLLTPSSGTLTIMGDDIKAYPRRIKRRIGLVLSESRSFFWRLTARQNLIFFASLYGLPRKDAESRIQDLLARLGQEDLAGRPLRECSEGMRQVLGLVRALVHDPQILLLDEPTRSLSPETAKKAHDLIRTFGHEKNRAVIMSSHNLDETQNLADRVAIIRSGGIIRELTPDQYLPDAGGPGIASVYSTLVEGGSNR